MAVARVEVGAERIDVEVDVPGCMGSVDDRDEAELAPAGDELLDGEEQSPVRGDVRDVQRACAFGHVVEELVER